MSQSFKSLYATLCLALAAQAAHAVDGVIARVGPSDCRPRDADSTCATAVAGAPVPVPPADHPDTPLYDGPLGGVPASGYAYWGFDFIADQTGTDSPVRTDEFVNRSNVPVTITLIFNFPTTHPCNEACLPGVEFLVDKGWFKIDPPFLFGANTASVSQTFGPGRGYGWIIGLWEATNPRLKVTVPNGSTATLQEVGLPMFPAKADEIAAVAASCVCSDGSVAACSAGSRFSNGLLGQFDQNLTTYRRAGAFSSCPPER